MSKCPKFGFLLAVVAGLLLSSAARSDPFLIFNGIVLGLDVINTISKNSGREKESFVESKPYLQSSPDFCDEPSSPRYDATECPQTSAGNRSTRRPLFKEPAARPSRTTSKVGSEGHCYESYRSASSWMPKASCNRSGGVIVENNGQLRRCQKRRLSPEECYQLVYPHTFPTVVAEKTPTPSLKSGPLGFRDDGAREGHCYENYRGATSWMPKASCNRSGGVIVENNGQLRRCQKRRLSPEECYRLVNRNAKFLLPPRPEIARRVMEIKSGVARHTSDLIVRQFPSNEATKIAYLRRNEEFTIQHKTGTGWAYIKFSNGRHGYVQSKDLPQVADRPARHRRAKTPIAVSSPSTAETTSTPAADTSALKTSELSISFQTKMRGRIVKRKVPRKRAKAWFIGPDGKESAKTLTWGRKKKRYTTTIKHQQQTGVQIKVKAFGKFTAVSVPAQLDGGVQSIELNLAKPILFIAWDPNLGIIKRKLRMHGVQRYSTAFTNFVSRTHQYSNGRHWSHLHVAAIDANQKPRAMISNLSGRAIQWNDKTTKGLNARIRDNVSNKGAPATKLVIERVGKFVRGFSYSAQSTRAQLIYVLEAPNTKASSRDLMRLEELLKQFQMDALILQFGHYPKGEALHLVTGKRRQFKHLQFVKVDITRAYDDIYFDGAFGFAVRHVAKQAKRRLQEEKILLAAKPTQVEPAKAKIPTPKQKPKAVRKRQAGLKENYQRSQRTSDLTVPYKASDKTEKTKKISGQPSDPITSLLKVFLAAPPPNQDQDDMDAR